MLANGLYCVKDLLCNCEVFLIYREQELQGFFLRCIYFKNSILCRVDSCRFWHLRSSRYSRFYLEVWVDIWPGISSVCYGFDYKQPWLPVTGLIEDHGLCGRRCHDVSVITGQIARLVVI